MKFDEDAASFWRSRRRVVTFAPKVLSKGRALRVERKLVAPIKVSLRSVSMYVVVEAASRLSDADLARIRDLHPLLDLMYKRVKRLLTDDTVPNGERLRITLDRSIAIRIVERRLTAAHSLLPKLVALDHLLPIKLGAAPVQEREPGRVPASVSHALAEIVIDIGAALQGKVGRPQKLDPLQTLDAHRPSQRGRPSIERSYKPPRGRARDNTARALGVDHKTVTEALKLGRQAFEAIRRINKQEPPSGAPSIVVYDAAAKTITTTVLPALKRRIR